MKKNFLKVFSLLLVISMLAISVNAVVTDKPQSDITIAADPGTVVLCQGNTVTVTLTMPTCYGIEGQWTATNGLTLTSLTRDGGNTLPHTNGVVEWTDVDSENQADWFKNPMTQMTATYTVSAAGTYTVDFTCTLFAGGNKITAENPNIEMWEGTFKYSVDIQVVEHDYSTEWTKGDGTHWHACTCGAKSEESAHADTATKDHKCDTCDYVMSECADGDDADHKCDHCGADNITEHAFGTEWKSDGEKHWKECACGEKNEVADHSDVTTDADHKCDVCEKDNVTEHKHNTYGSDETQHWSICDCGQQVGEKVNHDFTNGDCICGTEKPAATGLKGDIDLDGDVDVDDLTYFAKHIAKIITITNTQSLANAEVTGDDTVTVDDLTKLAKYMAKIIPSLD